MITVIADGQRKAQRGAQRSAEEAQRASAALRESEQRLAFALDAARMGTWEWDVATGKLTWSPQLEPIHGMAPGTFDGTFEGFMNLIHPDDRELFAHVPENRTSSAAVNVVVAPAEKYQRLRELVCYLAS